jgi:hypothetical protein
MQNSGLRLAIIWAMGEVVRELVASSPVTANVHCAVGLTCPVVKVVSGPQVIPSLLTE